MEETPGSSAARDAQSRPFKGSSRIVVASTVELIVDDEVWTSGGAAITSTVWFTCPNLTVISAFGIPAPDGSLINPESVAPDTWAATGTDKNKKRFRHSASARHVVRVTNILILASIMLVPLASWLGSNRGHSV